MTQERGLVIHFSDGSRISVSFPVQTDDQYRRKLAIEEILKRRTLIVEVDGAAYIVPFENIKYLSVFPAPEYADPAVIKGASLSG